MQESLTFNDLPKVVSQVLSKVERLERVLDIIKDEVCKKSSPSAEHTPMTIDEGQHFTELVYVMCMFGLLKELQLFFHHGIICNGTFTRTVLY